MTHTLRTIGQDNFCEVEHGLRLCYRTDGHPTGEPLLLISGLGQQLIAWPQSLVDDLVAGGFYVIRFDNRDAGRSSRVPISPPGRVRQLVRRFSDEQYTLHDMARDTIGLLDHLEIDRVHVVGMSMGGMIAQIVAASYPERVKTLTSIFSNTGHWHAGRIALSTTLMMLRRRTTDRDGAGEWMVKLFRHIGSRGFPIDEDEIRATALHAYDRGDGATAREGLARQIGAIYKTGDRTRELREVVAPTLVIHGDRDPMVHPSGGAATAAAIRGARLVTIDGMGHDLPRGAWPQLVYLIAQHAGAGHDAVSRMPNAISAPSLPSGPRTPKALNGALLLVARQWFFKHLQRRYGDAVTLPLPVVGKAVVVSDPDLVKAVFTGDPEVLHGGKNPLGTLIGPGSLFSMDEDRHLKERRMLLPAFHGDRMRSYECLIEEEALRAMASWPEDREFATLPAFQSITLRVILRAVFGADGAELAELEAMLPAGTALGQRLVTAPFLRRDLGPLSPGGRFRRSRMHYDQLIGRLIDKHLADQDLDQRVDVLALMLRELREDRDEIHRDAIADELLTLLVAGHETTASSLAWAVERLRRHHDVLRRLEEEAAGESSALRTSTILELQRHRTIIGNTARRAMQPFQLGRWTVPPGTVLLTSSSVMHADDRLHPHAADFDPDRYVDAKPGTYSWIPFGGGRPRCLGAAFALFEMDVVLRTLLRHFELVPTGDAPERESFRGLAYAPAKGGIGRVRRRAVPLGTADAASAARCPVEHAGVAA